MEPSAFTHCRHVESALRRVRKAGRIPRTAWPAVAASRHIPHKGTRLADTGLRRHLAGQQVWVIRSHGAVVRWSAWACKSPRGVAQPGSSVEGVGAKGGGQVQESTGCEELRSGAVPEQSTGAGWRDKNTSLKRLLPPESAVEVVTTTSTAHCGHFRSFADQVSPLPLTWLPSAPSHLVVRALQRQRQPALRCARAPARLNTPSGTPQPCSSHRKAAGVKLSRSRGVQCAVRTSRAARGARERASGPASCHGSSTGGATR